MKTIANNLVSLLGIGLMFFGGCSINDELGNFQPEGIAMLFIGVAIIFLISKKGDFYEGKN